jgi:HlyD family secretion protein
MVKLFHNKYVKYIILTLALVSIAIPCVIYGLIDKKNDPGYRSVKLERGDIASTILATGTLNPVILVQVGSQVSGNIMRLYADFNSVVKKNQVIAQIDPMLLKAEVEKARANYKAALANVEKAKVIVTDTRRTLNRYKALVKENLVSQSDLDTAQTRSNQVNPGFFPHPPGLCHYSFACGWHCSFKKCRCRTNSCGKPPGAYTLYHCPGSNRNAGKYQCR